MDAVAAARAFILQAPPGELSDCVADCRGIFGDDALESGIEPALEQYNTEQLAVASIEGQTQALIICAAGRIDGHAARFVHHPSQQSFAYDHIRSTASDPQPVQVDAALESAREALQSAAASYVAEHLHQGASAVYAPLPRQPAPRPTVDAVSEEPHSAADVSAGVNEPAEPLDEVEATPEEDGASTAAIGENEAGPPEAHIDQEEAEVPDPDVDAGAAGSREGTLAADADSVGNHAVDAEDAIDEVLPKRYTVVLVGNRYNPSNFWTGRWRATYNVNLETSQLSGDVHINVHYYEQGNVQLAVTKHLEVALPGQDDPASLSKAVFKQISAFEKDVQIGINEAHVQMNDRTLKDLRRALPLTKSKLDWNRIATFRTAKELKR